MAAAERTYSFRAPTELADRLRRAADVLAEGRQDARHIDEAIGFELSRAFLASAPSLRGNRSQSGLMRRSLELLIAATEKVASDVHYADEYRAVAADQQRDEETADAGMELAADLWRDE